MDHDLLPETRCIEWREFEKLYKNDKFSFMTINMRSVCNKFNEFIGHLSKLKGNITFILLTETWLSEAVDLLYEIPGYISYNMYRNGRGGGLKL